MTAPPVTGSDGVAVAVIRPRWLRSRVSDVNEDRVYTAVCLTAVVVAGAAACAWPAEVPSALQFPIIVVAGLLLAGRRLLVVYGVALAILLVWAPVDLEPVRESRLLVVLSFVAVMARHVRRRRVAGRSSAHAASAATGCSPSCATASPPVATLPDLPEGWRSASEVLSAHGDRFSGRLRRGAPEPVGEPPRDRARRRQRQGHPRRHPLAAALRCARRAARRHPLGRLPPRRERVPHPAGLGGGVRHGGAPRPRPADR